MKSVFMTLISSLVLIGPIAHATCGNKESKATATAKAIGELNGLKQIEVSAPVANVEEFGKFTISISGVRNGFYIQAGNYDITISDDGFCTVVSVNRGLSFE